MIIAEHPSTGSYRFLGIPRDVHHAKECMSMAAWNLPDQDIIDMGRVSMGPDIVEPKYRELFHNVLRSREVTLALRRKKIAGRQREAEIMTRQFHNELAIADRRVDVVRSDGIACGISPTEGELRPCVQSPNAVVYGEVAYTTAKQLGANAIAHQYAVEREKNGDPYALTHRNPHASVGTIARGEYVPVATIFNDEYMQAREQVTPFDLSVSGIMQSIQLGYADLLQRGGAS